MNLNRGSGRNAIRSYPKLVGDVEVEAASEGDEEDNRCHPCGEEEESGERLL